MVLSFYNKMMMMTRELRREKYANQEMVYSYYFML